MKAIGIIWNMGNSYTDEILNDISKIHPVSYHQKYNLGSCYNNFVLDCYDGDSEAFLEGYIYEKLNSMKVATQKEVTIFEISIPNPSFRLNQETNVEQCVETKELKKVIRDKYSGMIDGYFFDNLLHVTDNVEEYQNMQRVISKYQNYMMKPNNTIGKVGLG